MCQEQWNHGGSTVCQASVVQQGPPSSILLVHLETRILPHQLSQLARISTLDSSQHDPPPNQPSGIFEKKKNEGAAAAKRKKKK